MLVEDFSNTSTDLVMKAESNNDDTVVDMLQSKKNHQQNLTTKWSDLPKDLANLIVRKLYFRDQICFRAVCKEWSLLTCDRPVNELPWLMIMNRDIINKRYSKPILLDPVHKNSHTILRFEGVRSKYSNLFDGSRICASKGGWLLLGNSKGYNEIALFLYSPFTNNVIKLPTLSSITPYYGKATFSSTNPMSPDCVFVVTHCCEQYRLGISTYRNRDNKWKTRILDEAFGRQVKSLVCTEKGTCYFVLHKRKFGSFCIQSQEWGWLGEIPLLSEKIHLVELDRDLLVVGCSFNYNICDIYRYDDENSRGWKKLSSLGNKLLFVGVYGSYLRPAIGETTYLADKILFDNDDDDNNNNSRIKVCSLKDGENCKNVRAYDWLVKGSLKKIWIEPPY